MYRIITKNQLSQTVFHFIVEAPRIAKKAVAGQFVIVRVAEHGERIPLTIANHDPERGTIDLYVQIVGKSTDELCRVDVAAGLADVVGPLGMPTHIEKVGHVVCVGGGVGVAPMLPIARAYRAAGNRITGIIGAREERLLIMENEMRSVCDELVICTNDGSKGRKGLVIDPLREWLEQKTEIGLVFAIGPMVMMRAVCDLTRPYNVKTMVSLNTVMLDGTGMCGACRVNIDGQVKFTCVDGPDFDGHHVDFDELMNRQQRFARFEKESWQEYKRQHNEENCQCLTPKQPAS